MHKTFEQYPICAYFLHAGLSTDINNQSSASFTHLLHLLPSCKSVFQCPITVCFSIVAICAERKRGTIAVCWRKCLVRMLQQRGGVHMIELYTGMVTNRFRLWECTYRACCGVCWPLSMYIFPARFHGRSPIFPVWCERWNKKSLVAGAFQINFMLCGAL